MAQVRTRKNVWKLQQWDPILLWYAKAITELRTRPINDPTSWRYQSAIHEYRRDKDPYAVPSDVLPPTPETDRFWNQLCRPSYDFHAALHKNSYFVFFRVA